MDHLARSRAFGTINPPWKPAQCDREAFYQQGEGLFDMGGRLIVPGKPLDPAELVEDDEPERAEAEAKALAQEDAERVALRRAEADRRAKEREKAAESRTKASNPSRITPFWHPPEFDRPAHYQCGDGYLDERGREIIPGQPLNAEELAAAQRQEEDVEGLSLSQLVAQADDLPFNVLMAAAKAVIGPTCPNSKNMMVEQLRLLARKRPNDRVPRIRAT